jgi:hypothetical protein
MGCRDPDDIPGNTAHWFFAFFWLTEGSRNKKLDIYIKQIPLRTYLLRYLVIRAAMGTGRGENICKRLILTYCRTLVLHYLLQSTGV